MPTNDFKAFATSPGANVVDQASWAALTALLDDGFLSGLAQSNQVNKAWRQPSVIAYVIAQITMTTLGQDVLDDGDLATLVTQVRSALAIVAGSRNSRIVTASATLNLVLTDYAVGLNRTAALAAMNVQLPTGASAGQDFVVEDLVGNFQAYPVTVLPPAGDTLAGMAGFVMNVNRQSATFRNYGSTLWSIK